MPEWIQIIINSRNHDGFLELPSIAIKALNSSMSAALADARETGYSWSLSPGLLHCMLNLPHEKEDLNSLSPDLTLWLYAGENMTAPLTMQASWSYMVAHHSPGDQNLWCRQVLNVELGQQDSQGCVKGCALNSPLIDRHVL